VFINLRITYKDQTTKDIKAEWENFIAFEDEFDKPFTDVLDPKKSRLKHLSWLCWNIEKSSKAIEKTFEEWLKEISTCGFVPEKEVEDVLPLESKARTGA
jgi:hypothetical protein